MLVGRILLLSVVAEDEGSMLPFSGGFTHLVSSTYFFVGIQRFYIGGWLIIPCYKVYGKIMGFRVCGWELLLVARHSGFSTFLGVVLIFWMLYWLHSGVYC
jgi:hypothetical protein